MALRIFWTRAERAYLEQAMARVSRSFALMTPCFEAPLDGCLAIAYLLCRCADNIEDCDSPLADKRSCFAQMRGALAEPATAATALCTWSGLAWDGLTTDEGAMMREGGACPVWGLYASLPAGVRDCLSRWLAEMMMGMERTLDADAAPRFVTIDGLWILAEARDYHRYCYYVAGTVGHLITDLAELHYELPAQVALRLRGEAEAAGRALQKTNILKDFMRDLDRGKSYLPATWLHDAEFAPLRRQGAPPAWSAAVIGDVLHDLQRMLSYLEAIPPAATGFRLGLLLTWLPALATLLRAGARPEWLFTAQHDLKLDRPTMQQLGRLARRCAAEPAELRGVFASYANKIQSAWATAPLGDFHA